MATRDNTTNQPTPKSIREKLLRISAHVKTVEMASELLCQTNPMWFDICEVLESIQDFMTDAIGDIEVMESLEVVS